ncbi:MAG: phosphodiester glycosidase family protein [Candidatus Gastranaerophilales bacterium]|nr:phosphodiester glycosidase family protein [Candidatus Gastranaerophilales bacterium]
MKNFLIRFKLLIVFVLYLSCAALQANEKICTFSNNNGLYIFSFKLNTNIEVSPYVSDRLESVDTIAQKTGAIAVINTGFFDPKNKKSVSYVKQNGIVLANPKENENLTQNKELQPHLEKIFNRVEFRVLKCQEKLTADITYPSVPVPEKCELVSSTQAGPMLLPEMDLEKEFFVVKKDGKIIRDGASMTARVARSAVAVKDDQIFFIVTDKNHPLTIFELRKKLQNLGVQQAMGFDGGGSASLFVKQNNGKDFFYTAENDNISRNIKSALIVK